jgi:hypothetical protein
VLERSGPRVEKTRPSARSLTLALGPQGLFEEHEDHNFGQKHFVGASGKVEKLITLATMNTFCELLIGFRSRDRACLE